MNKSLAEKMGIKEYSRCYFENVSENFCKVIGSPPLNVSKKLEGEFDYIHIFIVF